MDDDDLQSRVARELADLTDAGAVLPLQFRPAHAFMLLAALQLAARHPGLEGSEVGRFVDELGHNIESRLCRTPALAEAARRGWKPEYDAKKEESKQAPAAAGRQTETKADAAKQSPKRGRK